MKPYPAYKDSGQVWLGDIPDHWALPRLKQVCNGPPEYGANISAQAYSPDGVRFIRTTDIREDGTLRDKGAVYVPQELVQDSLLDTGDFLISRSGTIGRSLVIDDATDLPAAYAGYLVRFRTKAVETARWAFLFSKTDQFRGFISTVVISSTIDNVNGQKYANMPIPLPPLDEQRAIADFLDGMDARITRFIAARHKMIALLEEKKQAVINQAVTRGLDPSVPMKDSGVDWLGEIPAHWDLKRIKDFLREVDERSSTGEEELLSVSHLTGVTPRSEKNITMFKAESYVGHRLCQPGDIVANTMWLWMGAIGTSRHIGIISSSYAVYRPRTNDQMSPDYLDFLLRSRRYVDEYRRQSTGIRSSRLRLYPDQFLRLKVAVPELAEQEAILHHIDKEGSRIDTLISRHRREIELMQEYRTRLISDVVTGKLDVRGVELPAVEEVIGEEIEAAMEDDAVQELEEIEA